MRTFLRTLRFFVVAVVVITNTTGCWNIADREPKSETPRLVLFVGMDISGSFIQGKHRESAIGFLAHYLFAHLNGMGGLEVPHSLFVGSIGGAKRDEPKTFYPIESFQNETIEGLTAKLDKMFPTTKSNPFTDFDAFFEQIGETVKNRKLILKPLSVVMLTDGKPDLGGKAIDVRFRNIQLEPLEQLSRNVTLRVLYTDAVTARNWTEKVPRKRVKIWTQDADVMVEWNAPKILFPQGPFAEQTRFFDWIKSNVDFPARTQRVEAAPRSTASRK